MSGHSIKITGSNDVFGIFAGQCTVQIIITGGRMAKTSLVTRIIVGLVLGVVVGALLNFFPEYKAWIISSFLQQIGRAHV